MLLGLRASGKSTLGAALARRLGWDFLDLDDEVARRLEQPNAARVIEMYGIEAFRQAEKATLDLVLSEPKRVLALGGGTPTADGAADAISAHAGPAVYLRATPETLADRLRQTDLATRPSLTGKGVVEEVGEMFRKRDALYLKIASHTVTTDALETIEEMVDAIQAALGPEYPGVTDP